MSKTGHSKNKRKQRSKARRRFWSDREKTNYECPDCGRRSIQLRTGFEVHHRDGDTNNNDEDNLIALCRPCHNLRENKKPSINEIELMQKQIDDSIAFGRVTPLAETYEELDTIYESDDKAIQPHMALKRIKRRKYVTLEIDFNSAKGWTPDGEEAEVENEYSHPCLDESTVEAVNAISKRYRDAKKPTNTMSALTTRHGGDFISFPPMLPEVARQLAAELRPLIMNEDNWELRH